MDKIKIGFFGCGFMGQLAHMSNYAALDTCEIVGVTDVKQKQAALVAAAYGIPKVYASARDMLADPAIVAVVAAQPFTNHVNIVCDVLNAGKHLLTEKPLCVYPQNGHVLVECAKANGMIHMVANHKRSDPAVEYAMGAIKAWKASGEMGALKYIRITMPPGDWVAGAASRGRPIITDEPGAAFAPEPLPHGFEPALADAYVSFVNYYIHQVNLMRHLLGEDYRLTYADKSGVLLVAESESGVSGIIEMAPYSTSDSWQESALVCFEHGYISIDLPAPLASQQAGKVTVFTDVGGKGSYMSPTLPNISAMRNQAANFIRAINGEISPPCQSYEALKDLEIAMEYILMIN
ncbi:MAG: Gfo/Idh/MocA family oxidoreductase [Oscillospiraceae bacterium]|nr:Gfo/Idh/MocA family oxidoreductase [Oscillospiraceae bacterium]